MVQQPRLGLNKRSQVVQVAAERLGDLLLEQDFVNWVAPRRRHRAHRGLRGGAGVRGMRGAGNGGRHRKRLQHRRRDAGSAMV